MKEFLRSPQIYMLFSIIGNLIGLGGAVVAAVFYRGKEGETYSFLNHHISELGELGVSKLAWLYNISLILSGLCLIAACISLGLIMPGIAPVIAIDFGFLFGASLCGAGVFPMNKLKWHGQSLLLFFRAGLITVAIFSLGIAIQPEEEIILSRWFALAGLPVIISNVVFLIMAPQLNYAENPILNFENERPIVLPVVIIEWLIFLTSFLWFVIIAWAL